MSVPAYYMLTSAGTVLRQVRGHHHHPLHHRHHIRLVIVERLDWINVSHNVYLHALVTLLECWLVERRWQQGSDSLLHLGGQLVWEFNGEHEEKISMDERILVCGHALVLHGLHHPQVRLSIWV